MESNPLVLIFQVCENQENKLVVPLRPILCIILTRFQ
jgi:hypothetical protein